MKTTVVRFALIAALAAAAAAPVAANDTTTRLARLRDAAVASYNERDWVGAATAADGYDEVLESTQLPRVGADYALVSFVGGHARMELWKQNPDGFRWDYDRDVLERLEKSLEILADDPFYKHTVLGNAYFEKLKRDNFRDANLENAANWHYLRGLRARVAELVAAPPDPATRDALARHALAYIGRAFEMARHSEAPDVYLLRVREACRIGFGAGMDDRFARLHDVVGFDDGNVRAGVLWQTALDTMNTADADPNAVLEIFREAATTTRDPTERAEIYRQMADYASRLDDFAFKVQAVEYGREAFKLDPANREIQVQFGTSLHVLSYAHFNSGRFEDALRAAQEATSFEWENDEVAYFDLARAQANFGDKVNALLHAERAYDKARRKFSGDELAPFRQNYANILRQFGLSAKASQVEAGLQGS